MENIVIPGLPAEYTPVITTLIGYVAGWLVGPLTAIWKKLGRTNGVTTVGVSAVLSLLVSLGFTIATTLAGGPLNIGHALVIALIAFVRANGAYLMQVQSNAKANKEAPPVVTQSVVIKEGPPAGVPTRPEDFGPSFRDVPLEEKPGGPTLRVE